MSFSKALTDFRKKHNATVKEMAQLIGIGERMYIHYEKGNYDGSKTRVHKYLQKLTESRLKDLRELNETSALVNSIVGTVDLDDAIKKSHPIVQQHIKHLEAAIADRDKIIKHLERNTGLLEDIVEIYEKGVTKAIEQRGG